MNMKNKLERDVRFLKAYAVIATLVCAFFVVTAFTQQRGKQKFEEIDVERINVVEKDGKLKMVISNKERQHPGIVDGKTIERYGRARPPGIIFFNEYGDECGGLIFDGDKDKGQSLALSFDKFRQDQVMQLQYAEGSNGRKSTGLVVWDRLAPDQQAELTQRFMELDKKLNSPEKQAAMKTLREEGVFGFERVWAGKGADQSAKIVLSDPKGRARIKLSVDATGIPRLEFLDEAGKVISSLPDASSPIKK